MIFLESLTISRHANAEDLEIMDLHASDLIRLSKIVAPNLKKLHFDCCIKADGDGTEVKEAFQTMLKGFPFLTELIIEGCFVTSAANICPKIVLDFPKLVHLQICSLGAGYKCSSTFETVEELPKKKPAEKLESNLEHFQVSINFPGTIPRLETIRLGVSYAIQTLYFKEFPVLKVFQVSSQWAEYYPNYFPPTTGRKCVRQECHLEELQFPESFQDSFTFTRILPHFPHLNQIGLKFPTIKFLRAFAKIMVTSGPESFQHLAIETQFDFASSLDACILDEGAKLGSAERKQLKDLKAYSHWEDYVKENQIELPEENQDPNESYGLGVLFKKLKSLSIEHLPRNLRLPKGPRHWVDDPEPEFTNTLIGFKEYPFSKAVEAVCPPTMEITCFNYDVSVSSKSKQLCKKKIKIYLPFQMSRVAVDFDFLTQHFQHGPEISAATPSEKTEAKIETNVGRK